ncbi:MAG: hypothetical protein ACR2KQ_03455 [Actinomycetota bacterium]
MTRYQLFLLVILMLWPLMIMGLLFLMSKIENKIARTEAGSPNEAGLEPVSGDIEEREVRIVYGDKVVGEER